MFSPILFPREVANPRRFVVRDKKEYVDFINNNISTSDLFTTVYNHEHCEDNGRGLKIDYNSAIIDRLYFDLDFKVKENGSVVSVDAYQNMVKLHTWCESQNLRHIVFHTGTGYNAFVSVNVTDLQNKKAAITNAIKSISNKIGIQVDTQSFDLARYTRIPFSFNNKDSAKRFVVSLNGEQIHMGHDDIHELARKQIMKLNPMGDDYLDIEEYDEENIDVPYLEVDDNVLFEFNEDIKLEKTPHCIKVLLSKKDCGWEDRRILITWLRDNGYLLNEVYSILKKVLSPEKFHHCVYDEKQPQYLYKRSFDLYFPRCETLQKCHLCQYKNYNGCGLRK